MFRHVKKANIDELKLSVARPGVTRKSFSGAGATLAWGTLSPGHEPRPHTHPHEQIVYIVSGHGTFTVGDETTEVKQGDVLVVPSGVLHYAGVLHDAAVKCWGGEMPNTMPAIFMAL